MVGVYYSWEYIVNMSDSIKTGIASVASKKGYCQKAFKNLAPKNLKLIQELTILKLLKHKENLYNTVSFRYN